MSYHGLGKRLSEPKAGDYDYDGMCVYSTGADTVSLGIFQWVPRANGKGLKRGKVVKRIRGPRGTLQRLCQRAEEWIAALEQENRTDI